MDDPAAEISSVIHALTGGSPSEQQETLEKYFTPNASFTHPFCRTGSFDTSFGTSRDLIKGIYRWYKILSPKIDLKVNSVAYDKKALLLYVNISQVFAIWLVPFYRAPVTLTTVLHLKHDPNTRKYLITSQNDLYQVDQFVRFVAPWNIGYFFVLLWHFWATAACVLGAFIFAPITWFEEGVARRKRGDKIFERNGLGMNGSRNRVDTNEDEVKKLMGFGSESGEGRFGKMTVVKPE